MRSPAEVKDTKEWGFSGDLPNVWMHLTHLRLCLCSYWYLYTKYWTCFILFELWKRLLRVCLRARWVGQEALTMFVSLKWGCIFLWSFRHFVKGDPILYFSGNKLMYVLRYLTNYNCRFVPQNFSVCDKNFSTFRAHICILIRTFVQVKWLHITHSFAWNPVAWTFPFESLNFNY